MDQLQNTETISTNWIESLALEEINMDETGVVHFSEHLDPSYMLEESSLNFMDILRERVEIYVNKFNEYRGHGPHVPTIKMFKISNTVNDFMLYRNSLRLVFARRANDLITIGFLSNSGGLFAARENMNTPADNIPHEIRAHVGPFNKISWRYKNEDVEVDILVKHYLTEFIRQSCR